MSLCPSGRARICIDMHTPIYMRLILRILYLLSLIFVHFVNVLVFLCLFCSSRVFVTIYTVNFYGSFVFFSSWAHII